MNSVVAVFRNLREKYGHAWVFLYGFIYMPWFTFLEHNVTSHYFVIHSIFDDFIPFNELFVIPYLSWFLFISVTVLYFFFTDKEEFYKLTTLLITGMTLFLVICTVFPNGLNLRPAAFARDNIFVDLVRYVYATDTPTNVLPSLHVYNSIACCIAIVRCQRLERYRWIHGGAYVLTGLIILSTMFLKQHSVVDVVAASVMIYFLYYLVYEYTPAKAAKLARQTI